MSLILVTRVKSQGFVELSFNIVTKDMRKLGYITNNNESNIHTVNSVPDSGATALATLTQNYGMQSTIEPSTLASKLN